MNKKDINLITEAYKKIIPIKENKNQETILYIIHEIRKLTNHQIPYYAYGDNEAANYMSNSLEKIQSLVDELEQLLNEK